MMRYIWIYQNHEVQILFIEKTGSVKSTSVTQFYDSMYLITKCLHFHYETDTVQRKDNIWQKLGRG